MIEESLADLATEPPASVTSGTLLGTGLVDGASVWESPVGDVVVAFNPSGVVSVDLASTPGIEAAHEVRFGRRLVEARAPKAWASRIDRAIEQGQPGDLPLDLRTLTGFQREILGITAAIPRGEVRPYGWLAKAAANPGAVRAVGSVMAKNPVPLVVPCHRVVRSDGTVGAYSLGGADNKRTLLDHEGVDPAELEALARAGTRFIGSDTTGIYCLPTCRHARRISAGHRIAFASDADAVAAGYRPCQVCTP